MKITVLGGSFNPPHLGHVLIIDQVLKYTDIEKIWLTPCYRHTFEKKLAPIKDRVAMTKLLTGEGMRFEQSPRVTLIRGCRCAKNVISSRCFDISTKVRYCNEEIKNKLSGDTIDLMEILQKKYLPAGRQVPKHQFSFLIGSDNLDGLKRWGRWEELVTNFQFLIYKRPWYSLDLSKYGLDNPKYKLTFIDHPKLITSNISSTQVRERLKNNSSIADLVPEKVEKYIKNNHLYY